MSRPSRRYLPVILEFSRRFDALTSFNTAYSLKGGEKERDRETGWRHCVMCSFKRQRHRKKPDEEKINSIWKKQHAHRARKKKRIKKE